MAVAFVLGFLVGAVVAIGLVVLMGGLNDEPDTRGPDFFDRNGEG